MQCLRTLLFTTACVLAPIVVSAQTPAAPDPDRSDPDVRVDALQPDFNLVALPTTLRMPAHKWAFRVTHRFTRPLGDGDFGDLVSDFFGFDSKGKLMYRGRLDSGRTEAPPPGAKRELVDAMRQIAKTGAPPANQTASIGCSIKWKATVA